MTRPAVAASGTTTLWNLIQANGGNLHVPEGFVMAVYVGGVPTNAAPLKTGTLFTGKTDVSLRGMVSPIYVRTFTADALATENLQNVAAAAVPAYVQAQPAADVTLTTSFQDVATLVLPATGKYAIEELIQILMTDIGGGTGAFAFDVAIELTDTTGTNVVDAPLNVFHFAFAALAGGVEDFGTVTHFKRLVNSAYTTIKLRAKLANVTGTPPTTVKIMRASSNLMASPASF